MRLRIHPENPQGRLIDQAVEVLKRGGVIIIPTDTVYALACDLNNRKGYDQLCKIKGVKPEKALFSCLCDDMKTVGELAIHVTTPMFKVIKRAIPGPYTFILEASKTVPKTFQSKRKTIGIRVPDNQICMDLMRALGNPVVVTSLENDDDIIEYLADPDEIWEGYEKQVDLMIDGGYGGLVASTVVDCSSGEMEILREGLGDTSIL